MLRISGSVFVTKLKKLFLKKYLTIYKIYCKIDTSEYDFAKV